VFLTNNAEYTDPVYDAWFLADNPTPSSSGSGADVFVSRSAASVLACTEMHQFCNPNLQDSDKSKCTRLTGRTTLFNELTQSNGSLIKLNRRQ
jgi:hypothetical protein